MMRVSLRWIKIFVYDLSVMSGFLDIWMVYIFLFLGEMIFIDGVGCKDQSLLISIEITFDIFCSNEFNFIIYIYIYIYIFEINCNEN